jgi:hypothetical protein
MGRLNENARIRARHYHKMRISENFSFFHLNEDYYRYFCHTVNPPSNITHITKENKTTYSAISSFFEVSFL